MRKFAPCSSRPEAGLHHRSRNPTLRQARRLADYVIYMGEVLESGPAKEVFNNPRHERTRAYLEGQI